MKIIELFTPDLGDTEKIEIVRWNVKSGDKVKEGDELVELVTEKAAFPVESPADGIIKEILVSSGIVRKGDLLGILTVE